MTQVPNKAAYSPEVDQATDPHKARLLDGDLCDRCHTEGGVKFLPLNNPTDYVCVGCMTPAERKATGWA